MLGRIRISCLLLLAVNIPQIVFNQTNTEVIDYTTSIRLERGRLITEHSYTIQVGNKQSEWVSDIEIPYNGNQKLEILEASIFNSQGISVRSIKSNEIITKNRYSNQSFFEDRLVKEFKLKHNEFPYQIKYRYRETDANFLNIALWTPYHRNFPVRNAKLQAELPLNYKMRTNYSGEFVHEKETLEKSVIYSWKISDIGTIKEELFSPHLREMIPFVQIVPVDFHYSKPGSFDNWITFGNWLESMNTGLDDLPQYEQEKVNSLIKGLSDPREVVKTLFYYLQDNTRYINVSIDIGGLKPYPASYVSHNKYGDCKALTIYMKALLKHAGIPSFYTVIYGGEKSPDINLNLPSQQFNHVILVVPIENDTIWLDNTANYLPYDYTGTFNQGRYALLVNSGESRLISTPAMTTKDVTENRVFRFSFDEQGKGSLKLFKDLHGRKFEFYRYIRHNYNEKDQKSAIEKELGLPNSLPVKWEFSHPDRSSRVAEIKLEMEVIRQTRNLGGSIVLTPLPLNMLKPETPDSRMNPVKIFYPVSQCDTIIYDLPFLYKYSPELPGNILIDTPYGTYSEEYYTENGLIYVVRNFQLFTGKYSLEEYSDFYSFLTGINNLRQKSLIILNPLR